jgi:conjugative relaxase-like TrwC/TraI family protein
MAAGVKKLLIGGDHTAEQAVGYLADPQARGDYYSERGAAVMFWLATDRARTYFGLGDHVRRATLTALLNGQHPVDGRLIRRPGPDGTMVGGIDVTLSPAPKSISVLWALGDDKLRAELECLVVLSVNAAISRMLRHVPLVRERYGPGPRDVRHVPAGDWVGVQVLHTTARLSHNKGIPDPQLHVHNVLVGALDHVGRLRAFDSRQILLYRSELDAEASAYLAERLRQLGYPIERTLVRSASGSVRQVKWEIEGMPAALLRAMSSRRREVEDLRRRYREVTGREAEGVGWERCLEGHRGPKATRSPKEMRDAWVAEAESYGSGLEHAAALCAQAEEARTVGVEGRDEQSPQAKQLRAEVLADLCREHALVPERELDKLVMQRSIGLLDPYVAMGVIASMFGDGDLLATTDGRVTTLEVLAAEQRAVAAAGQLLDAEPAPEVDRATLEEDFRRAEERGRPFDERQRDAVALATSGARFVSITGPAGTGKGYASHAMVAAWKRQDRRVLALALAGRTAQQAQADSGADRAYTLDGLAAAIRVGALDLVESDVLLVDEAGMIDHERYAALLEAAAAARATVVQVCDDKQLSPIGPGGLWAVTHHMAAGRDRVAELRVVRRARDPREAQAWTDIREGRVEKGLTWYHDQGRLRLYDTRTELLTGLVSEWWASGGLGVIVVDSSNAERDELNRIAQARRRQAGHLGADVLELANGRELRAGDRVLFNAIYKPERAERAPRPRRVENGTTGIVMSIDAVARTATIELMEPKGLRQLTVPASAPLELGYARHIVKGQGMTADVADVATGPMTRHNQLYTMVTRSRDGSRIHALRAEIEEMGAEPAHLEAAAGPTVDEYLRGIPGAAAVTAREAEALTIREIADRAARSATKEAIGARAWVPPSLKEAGRSAFRARVRAEREEDDSRRTREIERIRRRPSVPAQRRPEPHDGPMPARQALESVARPHARDFDACRVLAYYEVAGQLDIAADPAALAARLWLADREAVIVVEDDHQETLVRAAVTALDASAEPQIVRSGPAYLERRARREEWKRGTKVMQHHLVEPDVIERAYVVAPDLARHDHVVRGLSVAAHSHLVTRPPDASTAARAGAEALRLRDGLAARARAESLRQAAVAADLRSRRDREAHRQPAHDRDREQEHDSLAR